MFKVILILSLCASLASNYLLYNANKQYYKDNQKAVKFWAKQRDDKNWLLLQGFNSHEADEFIVHGCMDYYQYAKENK